MAQCAEQLLMHLLDFLLLPQRFLLPAICCLLAWGGSNLLGVVTRPGIGVADDDLDELFSFFDNSVCRN